MVRKIDNSVIEHVKILCYEVVLGEMINQETRNRAKETARRYLDNSGYKINWVKCDEENNPCTVIDANQVVIHVSEEDFPGSQSQIIHEIIL